MHRREVVVSAALPASPHFPRLLETYDDGDWVALAFDAIDGRPPHHPWDSGELDMVAARLEALHDALTPSPVPALEPAGRLRPQLFGGWAELAAHRRAAGARPLGAPAPRPAGRAWSRAGPRRARARRSSTATCAPTTCSSPPEGVVFVDWPHAAVGNPVFDVVAWAPSVVLEGGPPPEELLARHGPPRRGRPRRRHGPARRDRRLLRVRTRCDRPAGAADHPPFQAAQGAVALAWLRRRTGW